jgi:hypothetical protein
MWTRQLQLCSAAGLVGRSQEARCKEAESHLSASAGVEKELGRIDRTNSDPATGAFKGWDEMSHPSNVWTEQEETEEDMS